MTTYRKKNRGYNGGQSGNGAAPVNVNIIFKNCWIGHVNVYNADNSGGESGNNVTFNFGNADQSNEATAAAINIQGDNFSFAFESGPGDNVSSIDVDQTAVAAVDQNNEATIDQSE